jgi:hypothetical protein
MLSAMRVPMRSITAVLLVMMAAALPANVQATTPVATPAKVCHRGTPARIGGAEKCLQAGEYCATRYEHQYEHYGFECSTRYRPPRLRRE